MNRKNKLNLLSIVFFQSVWTFIIALVIFLPFHAKVYSTLTPTPLVIFLTFPVAHRI